MVRYGQSHSSTTLRCILLVLLLSLVGCANAATTLTAQRVLDEFGNANLVVSNVSTPPAQAGLPTTYSEHLRFTIAESGTDGGDVFVCANREYCAALFDYFDAAPTTYLFEGADSRVLVRLDPSVDAVLAAQFQAVVDHLDQRPADD